MTGMADTVFLFDVDNTLLDNDRVQAETVFPRQGHYATDPDIVAEFPPADITVAHIGDLLKHDLAALTRR
jgi:FMN phosphatase YigB (HAD superfamily)